MTFRDVDEPAAPEERSAHELWSAIAGARSGAPNEAEDDRNEQQDQRNPEQYARAFDCHARDAAKAQKRGDEGDDQKHHGPIQKVTHFNLRF